jgi:hypothetical protein
MTDTKEDRIRKRAHQIWEGAGQPDGLHEAHWSQAVADVEAEDEAAGEPAKPAAAAKTDSAEKSAVKKTAAAKPASTAKKSDEAAPAKKPASRKVKGAPTA